MSQYGALIVAIDKVSFMLDDLRLYLDTHPQDEKALLHYNACVARRKELVAEYTRLFGPLSFYCANDNFAKWKWNDGPMPWEGVC